MESVRRLIIGTAGHIDHGKTALVKALTGKNTDRLKEEQERGISIDIDFAPLRFGDGTVIGIVDVPGHERFVRNMVAGAAGVDGALLVVDIREGVMPQTLEHAEILELLGVSTGMIVLTKCDLVDDDWMGQAPELVRAELKDTIFSDAEIVSTSIKTGLGIEELRQKLFVLAQGIRQKDRTGSFRMPVDKRFSIPGFGTVVSGTVWQGTIQVGDQVECVPGSHSIRVRGIQVHGESVQYACAGERAALNLAGIDKADIRRGHVIAAQGTLCESNLLDVHIEVPRTAQSVLHHREPVHVHLGTSETTGRVLLLGTNQLSNGSSGLAQLQLDGSIAAVAGDKLVIRGGTPFVTIAGGHVIDSAPKRLHRRNKQEILESLAAKDHDSPWQRILAEMNSGHLLTDKVLFLQLQMKSDEARDMFLELAPDMHIVRVPSGWLTEDGVCAVLNGIETILLQVHEQNRFRKHVLRSVVTSKIRKELTEYTMRDIDWFIEQGQSRGMWMTESANVTSLKWQVHLKNEEEALLNSVLHRLNQFGLCPPSEADICISYGKQASLVKLLLFYAKEEGYVISPSDGVYWHEQVLRDAISHIELLAKTQNQFSVANVRDKLSISRKYAVMLLEYLDMVGVTKRIGDERILLQHVTNS